MEMLEDQEQMIRQLDRRLELQNCLGNQSIIYEMKGQYSKAMELLKSQEMICRELSYADGLAMCLNNQGIIFEAQNRLKEALALYQEGERIAQSIGKRSEILRCRGNQASIIGKQGDHETELRLLLEIESDLRKLTDLKSLQITLGNIAGVLLDQGRSEDAIPYYFEKENICRNAGIPKGLMAALHGQAVTYERLGEIRKAFDAMCQYKEILIRTLNVKDSKRIHAYEAITDLAKKLDEQRTALEVLDEAVKWLRSTKHKENLAKFHEERCELLEMLNDVDDELSTLEELEQLWRELANPEAEIAASYRRINLLLDRGESKQACQILETGQMTCRKLDNVKMIMRWLSLLSAVRWDLGADEDAWSASRELELIARQENDHAELSTCLSCQGTAERNQGNLETAITLLEESLNEFYKAGLDYSNGGYLIIRTLAEAWQEQGDGLMSQSNYISASHAYKSAISMREKLLDDDPGVSELKNLYGKLIKIFDHLLPARDLNEALKSY